MEPRGMPSSCLREKKDVVPQAGFQMALQLGEIEIRAAAAFQQFRRVVEEEQAEIEERRGDRLAIQQHVFLIQVPAARTDQQGGGVRRSARSASRPDSYM